MRTLTLAAAAVSAGLVLTAGTAVASPGTAKDKSDDAPATADITRVSVDNGAKYVTIKVKLTKASAARTNLAATLDPVAEGASTYVVSTTTTPKPASTKRPKTNNSKSDDKAKGPKDKDTKPTKPAKSKAERVGVTLEKIATDGSGTTTVACDGLKATLSKGRNGQSALRVPQSCLGTDAGDLVVTVVTETGSGATVDSVRELHATKS